ncbi:MAG: phosphoglucosamine mutase [Eubacterium sp.]|nr:phosphoglucosamine mutase [Eubacterium sp.]
MKRLFGTDGVRGVANSELTVDLAMQLGQAGAYVLTRETSHQPVILVGCDTRISGEMLANALMAGLCSVGANVEYAGVVPTPAIAYLTRSTGADAGVVISASHNPMEFNGIKFFNGDGFKLSDALEDEIEGYIRNGMKGIEFPVGEGVGRITHLDDAVERYVNFAAESAPVDLSGLKIVIDCAEGASYQTSVRTFERLGAQLIPIHVSPDGTNINRDCGSTHMEELSARVVEEGADLGLAFDGDADRLLAVDENGNLVDGDQLMSISALYLRDHGLLKNDTLVVTVMSNLGLIRMARREGLNLETTKVGDRYVLERMREVGASIGGEQSGHIIYLDKNTTGDGLLSALYLLSAMVESGRKLSDLATVMEILPQVLINAPVDNENKHAYMSFPAIAQAIEELEEFFSDKGRVLIRPSGTEPLVRVMIEGDDEELIRSKAQELATLITETMSQRK